MMGSRKEKTRKKKGLLGPPTDETRRERENKSGLTPAASTGQFLLSSDGCQNTLKVSAGHAHRYFTQSVAPAIRAINQAHSRPVKI